MVKPLAARRKLLKKARRNGKVVSSRYSPLRQSLPDIFDELVHFTGAFPHPNLQLDVVMTDQTEVRVPAKRKTWRRKHSVQDRTLVEVQDTKYDRYQAFLESALAFYRGAEAPVSIDETLETIAFFEAAAQSAHQHGALVALNPEES